MGDTRRLPAIVALLVALATVATVAPDASATSRSRTRVAAALDRQNLRLAALDVQAQALAGGALRHPVRSARPAVVLFRSVEALLNHARAMHADGPTDMRDLMGRVPFNLGHHLRNQPYHRPIWTTHTLRPFRGPVAVGGSAGIGSRTPFRLSRPAPFQAPDGVYVDPTIPLPAHPTIATVALRTALKELGHPYVWGGAGPATFDCSGLVRWAYGHAGIALTHYTVSQWNQGRLIRPRAALPGDLVLVGHTLHHVGMYLAAGWMLNAPLTGHYVDVVPVPRHVAGLIRP